MINNRISLTINLSVILPLMIFLIMGLTSLHAYEFVKNHELEYIKAITDRSEEIEEAIASHGHKNRENYISLPKITMISGISISLLLALTLRYVFISRMKSAFLKRNEETFRLAMEHASIGMALVDLQGRWLQVNEALVNLLGYTREQLLSNDFQSITHPDDLQRDIDYVKRLLAGEIKTYQMEKRYYHHNGSIIWTLLSVALVRGENNKPKCFISQIQDITHQKEMERLKNEFISTVSHELRTPLTSIRGSLGLIAGVMSKELPAKVNHLVDIAFNNSERLIVLINDILDIDKIASGHMRFDIKPENLYYLLNQAADANLGYAEKFGIRIILHDLEDDIRINVDEARFIQVISNLLSNAIKFSPKGKDVEIYTERKEKKVRIYVKDKGTGIPTDFHSKLFGKFSQADSSSKRTRGGTGLGLHISKQIVEYMNGAIGFESDTDSGSVFWIEFDIAPNENKIPVRKKSKGQKIQDTAGLPLILHVEDDADFCKMIDSSLEGKAVIHAIETVEEAAELMNKYKYDLIIIDIALPGDCGLKLIDIADKESKLLILSASDVNQAINRRVHAALVKSKVTEEKVIQTIMDFLPKKGSERSSND